MKTRNLLLFAICFSLIFAACNRRLRNDNSQPTAPAATPVPAQNTIATNPPAQPTATSLTAAPTEVLQAATQPPTPVPPTTTPPPAATVTPESDASGDELENLLQQLDATNTAADQDIQNLPNP